MFQTCNSEFLKMSRTFPVKTLKPNLECLNQWFVDKILSQLSRFWLKTLEFYLILKKRAKIDMKMRQQKNEFVIFAKPMKSFSARCPSIHTFNAS